MSIDKPNLGQEGFRFNLTLCIGPSSEDRIYYSTMDIKEVRGLLELLCTAGVHTIRLGKMRVFVSKIIWFNLTVDKVRYCSVPTLGPSSSYTYTNQWSVIGTTDEFDDLI